MSRRRHSAGNCFGVFKEREDSGAFNCGWRSGAGRGKRGVTVFYWDDQKQKKRKGFGPRAEAGGNILAFGGPSSSFLQPSSVALQLERRWESKDCCREGKEGGCLAKKKMDWLVRRRKKEDEVEDDRKMLAMSVCRQSPSRASREIALMMV